MLQELHSNHPGVTRMKSVARSYVWWPNIDRHIEDLVKSCVSCQQSKDTPPLAPLHPWIWPSKPWQRLHIDFAGPFLGKMFFILVDAHSKWPEVIEMTSTTSQVQFLYYEICLHHTDCHFKLYLIMVRSSLQQSLQSS